MQKLLILLFAILFLNTKALKINPLNTQFPKITYTKIHDISYRGPIYFKRKRPFVVTLIKQLNNLTNDFINELYDS